MKSILKLVLEVEDSPRQQTLVPRTLVEQDVSTTPQVGHASDGGEFISPNPLNGGDGNTGRARAPSERGPAGSENSVSEQALPEQTFNLQLKISRHK
jgi:hypothetical protein